RAEDLRLGDPVALAPGPHGRRRVRGRERLVDGVVELGVAPSLGQAGVLERPTLRLLPEAFLVLQGLVERARPRLELLDARQPLALGIGMWAPPTVPPPAPWAARATGAP